MSGKQHKERQKTSPPQPPPGANTDPSANPNPPSASRSPPIQPQPSSSDTPLTPAVQLPVPNSPPRQWYYNDDYTDPVNFGFMFPVPPSSQAGSLSQTNVQSSSPSSHNSGPTTIIGPSVPLAASSRLPKGRTFLPKSLKPEQIQIPEAAKFVSVPTKKKVAKRGRSPPLEYSELNTPQREVIHNNLSYRPSPEQISSVPLTQCQSQPHGHPISQPESFVDSNSRIYDNGSKISEISAFAPIHTIESFATIAAPKPTRRAAHLSPGPHTTFASTNTTVISTPNFKNKRSLDTGFSQTTGEGDDTSLCLRCHRYKLDIGPKICNSCLRASNFNPLPSARGIRRADLESLVVYLLPSHAEDFLSLLPANTPRNPTWRILPRTPTRLEYDLNALAFQDRLFVLAKKTVLSTGLFGEDFAELLDVAQSYHWSLQEPNKCFEACCDVLIAASGLYKCSIAVGNSNYEPRAIPVPDLLQKARVFRVSMRRTFEELQNLALAPSDSTYREVWLPSFLSACMLTVAATIFLDFLVSVPSPYREQIWGVGWNNRIAELRHGGYGILMECLIANTRGVNPLKMDCWTDNLPGGQVSMLSNSSFDYLGQMPSGLEYTDDGTRGLFYNQVGGGMQDVSTVSKYQWVTSDKLGSKAERERNILVGNHSPAALLGILQLKDWQLRHGEILKMGEDMFTKDLYRLARQNPIGVLWRLFEMK